VTITVTGGSARLRTVPDLPRRRVLAGLALAWLAGACEPGTRLPAPTPTTTEPPPPDPLLAELIDERALLATYDAATGRHPALQATLAGPRADHVQHVAALERALGTAASPVPRVGGVGVPGAPASALAALRSAERAASNARAAAALTAPSDRAGLLASIAASEATHELVLR
jgi:hypothetical protein